MVNGTHLHNYDFQLVKCFALFTACTSREVGFGERSIWNYSNRNVMCEVYENS